MAKWQIAPVSPALQALNDAKADLDDKLDGLRDAPNEHEDATVLWPGAPWHGPAAHRPLGSINRVRRAAYAGSAGARSPRGRCPVHEP